MAVQTAVTQDPYLTFVLSTEQRDLLLSVGQLPREFARPIGLAARTRDGFEVTMPLVDVAQVVGSLERRIWDVKNRKLAREIRGVCTYLEDQAKAYISDNLDEVQSWFEQHSPGHAVANDLLALLDEMDLYDEDEDEITFDDLVESVFNDPELISMVDRFLDSLGHVPLPEVGGLSPAQFLALVSSQWNLEDSIVRLNDGLVLDDLARAPLFLDARTLLRAVRDGRAIPATADGRFRREFVLHVLPQLPWVEMWRLRTRKTKPILKELDAFPIPLLRTVLDAAGLIEEEDRFIKVTEHGELLLDDERVGMLYCAVFQAFFQGTCLADLDPFGPHDSLQEMIGYSLFRLSNLGSKWYALDKFVDRILADPVKWDLELLQPKSREAVLRARIIEPLKAFGLLEMRGKSGKKGKAGQLKFRKTPLVDRFLSFRFD